MTVWIAIALLVGVAYGLTLRGRPPSPARAAAKTLPLALLAGGAAYHGAPPMLVAAFALSALGDWFLAGAGDRRFLGGLAAFLLAHLSYCAAFLADPSSTWTSSPYFLGGAMLIMLLVLGLFRILAPTLGGLKWPVAAYCGAVAAMAVAALGRGPDPILLGGVGLFAASDAVLGYETFRLGERSAARRLTSPTIWFAYLGGQLLIAHAMLVH